MEGGGGERGLGSQHTMPCRGISGGEVQECSCPWCLGPGPWGSRQGPIKKACGSGEGSWENVLVTCLEQLEMMASGRTTQG